jgi:VWFA-related protein
MYNGGSRGSQLMAISTRLGRFLLLTLLASFVSSARQTGPHAATGNRRIYLDVVVTPKSGAPVSGLEQQDFTLLDNKAPLPIATFEALTSREAPIEVVLVIDAVNSPVGTVDVERIQVDKFLRAEGGHLLYPVAVDVFTDTGMQTVADFSSDGNALSTALQQANIGLRVIGRSGGFYGAADRLQLSVNALRQLSAKLGADQRRKIILWISPGWPFLPGAGAQMDSKQHEQVFANIVGLSALLEQTHVTLYSIDPRGAGESPLAGSYYEDYVKGITKPNQAEFGNMALQVIAVQSGGLAFNSSNDIAGMLQECISKSAPYYEISFYPARAEKPNEYHHIEMKVGKPGLTARSRQGYYGQP